MFAIINMLIFLLNFLNIIIKYLLKNSHRFCIYFINFNFSYNKNDHLLDMTKYVSEINQLIIIIYIKNYKIFLQMLMMFGVKIISLFG